MKGMVNPVKNIVHSKTRNYVVFNSALIILAMIILSLMPSLFVYFFTSSEKQNVKVGQLILLLICYVFLNVVQDSLTKKNEAFYQALSEAEKAKIVTLLFRFPYETLLSSDIRNKTANMLFSIDNQSLLIRYYEMIITLMSAFIILVSTSIIVSKVNFLSVFASLGIILFSVILNDKKKKIIIERTSKLLSINKGLSYFGSLLTKNTFLEENKIFDFNSFLNIRYQKYIDNVNRILRSKVQKVGTLEGLSSCLGTTSLLVGSLILALKSQNKSFSAVSTSITALFTFVRTVENTFITYQQFSAIKTQLTSYFELKKMDIDIIEKREESSEYAFCLDNISYSYDEHRKIIDGVTMKVKRGETIALVGENGSGKTTLIGILSGILTPQYGKITYNLNSKFAFVQQCSVQFPEMIRDNIVISLPYDSKKIENVLEILGLNNVVSKLTLGDRTMMNHTVNDDGIELSGGQFQRLTISRGIYGSSDVLILDEPTASLDVVNEYKIFETIHKLTQIETKVFISHRLSNCRYADRIYYLENGKVKEVGNHNYLMQKKGKYYELYTKQSELYSGGNSE